MNRAAIMEASLSPWLLRALPFACYIFFLACGSLLASVVADSRWIYALQAGMTASTLILFGRSYSELWQAQPALSVKASAMSILIGAVVFVAWVNLDVPILSLGNGRGFDPRGSDGTINVAWMAVRITGAALIVPVMEELFWRSLVMRWLVQKDFLSLPPRLVGWSAVFLSSLVFGFEHSLWIAGIVAGLAYAALYRQTGTLWSAIIAHAVTNFMLGCWVVYSGRWQLW